MTKIDKSFGDPSKSEDQKYLETLMADMGLQDLDDLSPSERKAYIDASKPTYKMKRKSSLEFLYKVAKKRKKKRDPKKGTGKKPKGSGRRLYTDENPKDTCSVSFTSASAIRKTFSTSCFKSKSHARQSQIINLVHQRVRAAYRNAKDPKVKKRLKKALEYAEKRKESSKKKTERLRSKKSYSDIHNLYKIASENISIEDLMSDPNTIIEFGDLTDLNNTNISPEEAMQLGYMLAEHKFESKELGDDLANDAKDYNKPRKGQKKRWSTKYKKNINCNNPKGFSQKQYCKRKKRGGSYK
jgi:hypothetical protein